MTMPSVRLKPDPLDLALGQPLFRAVIEFRRARPFMRRHLLDVLQRTTAGSVGGEAVSRSQGRNGIVAALYWLLRAPLC